MSGDIGNNENNNIDNTIKKYDQVSLQFYVMYHMVLKTKNENQFVLCLSEFMETIQPAKFMEISNIKNLIFDLKNENLLYAYKMALLVYVKSEISLQIANSFIDLTTNQINTNISYNISYVVNKLAELRNDNFYMDSYKLVPLELKLICNDGVDKNGTNNVATTNTAWYFETKHEILNRLGFLRNYFGLSKLQKFKIKNMTYEDVENMTFKKTAKLYNRVIGKIKKAIRKNIQLCEAFLEVEKTFVSSLITSDSNIDDLLAIESVDVDINNDINNDFFGEYIGIENVDEISENDCDNYCGNYCDNYINDISELSSDSSESEIEISNTIDFSDLEVNFDDSGDNIEHFFDSISLSDVENIKFIVPIQENMTESFEEFNRFNELDKILLDNDLDDIEDDILDEEL